MAFNEDKFKEKCEKVSELGDSIGIWINTIGAVRHNKEINELQKVLEHKLKTLEEKGMDARIEIMEKVLSLLKDEKLNNKKN
jgi:uncharacterized cupin superfamily protein